MSRKLNLARVYADVEDHLIPTLRLDPYERALYYYLLRHTRLEGKRSVCASRRGLANSTGIHTASIHRRIQSLERKGCIRIVERRREGKLIQVELPREIPACVPRATARHPKTPLALLRPRDPEVRQRLARRERGRCFYCRRPLNPEIATVDHVIPLAFGGTRHEHNLVACCFECNTKKHEQTAESFFAKLHAQGLITGRQFIGRLKALRALRNVVALGS